MFRVYLDGNLQDVDNVINVNEVAQFTIIREDGFNSTEQILREKSDMEISFSGASYRYICQQITSNRCAEIVFRIEDLDCGLFFDGVIPVVLAEFDLTKCIVKCKVKDNSFSAYIRDFLNVEIRPFNTRTKNCLPLTGIIKDINMPSDPNNNTTVVNRMAFDVLDLITYIVNYFTDNEIPVVSNYLTANTYAVTSGINLKGFAVTAEDIYPLFSLQTLFDEVRKKDRIYMGIEYDSFGAPYLRIEEEDYFFGSTLLMDFDEIPNGAIQTYDVDRNFNVINVGSDETEVTEGSVTYPQIRYTAWNEESYVGCGTCTGNKDSELDLVSNYIIDSNLIYEALNVGNVDYTLDDNIFLFKYDNTVSPNVGIVTLDATTGDYYYNDSFRNENVLQEWISYYAKCMAIERRAKYGFLAVNTVVENVPIVNNDVIEFTIADICPSPIPYDYYLGCFQEIYDLQNTLTLISDVNLTCNDGYKMSQFECVEAGIYEFSASSDINCLIDTNLTDDLIDATIICSIVVFSDNTLTTKLQTLGSQTINFVNVIGDPTQIISFSINSGSVSLAVGNVVMCETRVDSVTVAVGARDYAFRLFNSSFSLTYDEFSCEDLEYNDQNSKPFVVEFGYPLCFQEWQLMRENKNGFVRLKGEPYWIKEVTYRHKQLSTLKLIGNNPLCGC